MRIALYQPDIPQNTGAMLRTAACLGVPVDVIGPCGFAFSEKALRRVGMDYVDRAQIARHDSWEAFLAVERTAGRRLVLLTTRAEVPYFAFRFRDDDVLVMGRESAGVPEAVEAAVDARLRIPLAPGMRSLNVVVAAAVVLGEALRQTRAFPET
ncbi:MAG TPA: tRNA (cytidine(34)-2'-O)-methyltransferase [Rhodospirillales bacterium]|nr:tRNA (cytidine(34)-2'-O)-methyltransferase [Rhodospirillales bacterium]HJO69394.1 tRNA (cytidine(34)-2'-O)-methyltransferase [Rhodospirillales bacterium]